MYMTSQKQRWPKYIYRVGEEPDARVSLANERTALAGLRTALALVATGLGAAALKNSVSVPVAFSVAAIILSIGGAVLAIVSVFRWANVEIAIRTKTPLPAPKGLFTLAVVILIVGIISILAIIT